MGAYLADARIVEATRLLGAIAFAKRHRIGTTSTPVYLDIGSHRRVVTFGY